MKPIRDDSRSVNVEWFSGSDHAKIMKAIDELRPNGGTIWLPRDTYLIDQIIKTENVGTYQQGLNFVGAGAYTATELVWTGAPTDTSCCLVY